MKGPPLLSLALLPLPPSQRWRLGLLRGLIVCGVMDTQWLHTPRLLLLRSPSNLAGIRRLQSQINYFFPPPSFARSPLISCQIGCTLHCQPAQMAKAKERLKRGSDRDGSISLEGPSEEIFLSGSSGFRRRTVPDAFRLTPALATFVDYRQKWNEAAHVNGNIVGV